MLPNIVLFNEAKRIQLVIVWCLLMSTLGHMHSGMSIVSTQVQLTKKTYCRLSKICERISFVY